MSIVGADTKDRLSKERATLSPRIRRLRDNLLILLLYILPLLILGAVLGQLVGLIRR